MRIVFNAHATLEDNIADYEKAIEIINTPTLSDGTIINGYGVSSDNIKIAIRHDWSESVLLEIHNALTTAGINTTYELDDTLWS